VLGVDFFLLGDEVLLDSGGFLGSCLASVLAQVLPVVQRSEQTEKQQDSHSSTWLHFTVNVYPGTVCSDAVGLPENSAPRWLEDLLEHRRWHRLHVVVNLGDFSDLLQPHARHISHLRDSVVLCCFDSFK